MGRRSGKAKSQRKAPAAKRQQVRRQETSEETEEAKMPTHPEEPTEPVETTQESEPVAAQKPKKAKKATTRESRKAKAVRMRVVWGVFSSSVQCVQTFPYPQKKEAEALAAKLTAEKKSLFFVQPVREPIAEELPP
jgi:hypothetical protein